MLGPLVRFERAAARFFLFLAVVLILAAFYAGKAHGQSAPVLTFTSEVTRSVESAVPKLTWATTPAATSCTASGDAAWTGTKTASGTVTLPAITSSKNYSLVCTWPGDAEATLKWTAPTTYTNGDPLTVAKYTFAYGTIQGDVTTLPVPATVKSVTLNAPATTHHLSNVGAAGTYWFCGRAWDAAGLSSDCGLMADGSTLPSKVITGSASQTRSVSITIDPKPASPTGLTVE